MVHFSINYLHKTPDSGEACAALTIDKWTRTQRVDGATVYGYTTPKSPTPSYITPEHPTRTALIPKDPLEREIPQALKLQAESYVDQPGSPEHLAFAG